MATNKVNNKIAALLQKSEWAQARALLERERDKEPDNHWVLTQLGVTYYEQGRYDDALELFAESLPIVPDCPLTLWNIAGTLDALGRHAEAVPVYVWLLQSNKSPAEDPCWESKEWTETLKTDCLYRLGVCSQMLGKTQQAQQCFHQYANLLLSGIHGSYPIEDVMRQLQGLHRNGKHGGAESELRKAVASTLEVSGIEPRQGRATAPPKINTAKVLSGRPVASKR